MAKRSAREERAKQFANMLKMSPFLKPADSAPLPMTTELELNPAFISAEAAVAMEIGTDQNRAQKTTMLSLTFQINLVDIFAQEKARKRIA